MAHQLDSETFVKNYICSKSVSKVKRMGQNAAACLLIFRRKTTGQSTKCLHSTVMGCNKSSGSVDTLLNFCL